MTIIISDLHLGAPISRVKYLIPKLEAKLELGEVKRLILNGDIFQDLNFKRLKKYHWNFISLIRKWSDRIEIVWIFGNHDDEIIDVMKHLAGVDVHQKYIWKENNKTYCAIHGHQFDTFIGNHKFLSKFFSWLYTNIQKLPGINRLIANLVNFGDITFSRSVDKVRSGAINFAKRHEIDVIFCGHTHKSEKYEQNNVTYINTGNWISDKGTLVSVSDDVEIYEFSTNRDDS